MVKKVAVIGLGEVGAETFRAIRSRLGDRTDFDVIGMDINRAALARFRDGGVTSEFPADADVYLIAVYTDKQVFEVLDQIPKGRDGRLIVIESTLSIEAARQIQDTAIRGGYASHVAACPHRYNPNDPAHHVFNQPRILGGADSDSYEAAREFYSSFGAILHRAPDMVYACASKLLENSYRFAEIVLAQEFTSALRDHRLHPETVIALANTKWNIKMLEARDGVKGKCLPKDIELLNRDIGNEFIKILIGANETYKASCKER